MTPYVWASKSLRCREISFGACFHRLRRAFLRGLRRGKGFRRISGPRRGWRIYQLQLTPIESVRVSRGSRTGIVGARARLDRELTRGWACGAWQ